MLGFVESPVNKGIDSAKGTQSVASYKGPANIAGELAGILERSTTNEKPICKIDHYCFDFWWPNQICLAVCAG